MCLIYLLIYDFEPWKCDIEKSHKIMSIANFEFYEYSQLLEKIMGINNFVIMGIEDFIISNYGNHQLHNIFMEFELWDKNTSKLWVSKSFLGNLISHLRHLNAFSHTYRIYVHGTLAGHNIVINNTVIQSGYILHSVGILCRGVLKTACENLIS